MKNVVAVSAKKEILQNSRLNIKYMLFGATKSIYDKEQNKRFIKVNQSDWARQVYKIPKQETPLKSLRTAVKNTVNEGVKLGLYKEINKNTIAIVEPEEIFVEFSRDFAVQLYTLFTEPELTIYIYLVNKYERAMKKKKTSLQWFTQQELGILLGYSITSRSSYDSVVKEILRDLLQRGLIGYSKFWHSGYNNYLYKINFIRKRMIISDSIAKYEEEMEKKYETAVEATEIPQDLDETQLVEVYTVGMLETAEKLRERLIFTASPFRFLSEVEQKIYKDYYGEPKLDPAGFLID